MSVSLRAAIVLASVLGGYAFARLRFPGRDNLFLVYLGTIMIPFVVLIIPLYRLMVLIGWVDNLASLVLPWVFTAYGTFLMRQFFITIPKELEEAALIDGASRLEILRRIFIPASVPALATQATFTFLYAWNSFLWPLIVINTANEKNHVLTLALSIPIFASFIGGAGQAQCGVHPCGPSVSAAVRGPRARPGARGQHRGVQIQLGPPT